MLLNFMHPSNIGKTIAVTNAIANSQMNTNERIARQGEVLELAIFIVAVLLVMMLFGLILAKRISE